MKRYAALAALLVAVAGSAAASPCRTEADAKGVVAFADAADGWCLAGAVAPEAPDSVRWPLDARTAGLWSLRLEALPGQGGALRLDRYGADDSLTNLWQGMLAPPEGSLVSPPLFLWQADYAVAVGAADGTLVYRLRLEPGPALPAILPVGGTLVGPAAALVEGAGSETLVPWRLDTAEPGMLWTFAAQPVLGASVVLALQDEAGNTILSVDRADVAGVFRLPDLALASGAYRLSLRGLEPGQAAILTADVQARPATFAAEPDDTPATAHPLAFGTAASGRLTTAGTWDEHDVFLLTIPPEAGTRRVDARLTGSAPAPLTLSLIDEAGTVLYERQGQGEARLSGLALAPGRHWLRVSGTLGESESYRLVVEDGGGPAAGEESEPNDVPAAATPLPAQGDLAGSFTGDDRDYVDLGVSGALRLWNVSATGDGLARLALFDSQNDIVASASATAGDPVLRLSRLLLPPGRNRLRLEGDGGRWLLHSEALGPPVAGEEFEPNDDAAHALDLAFDMPQRGWLDRPDDRDVYAFHLAAEQHVLLEIVGPADFPIQASLAWGGQGGRIMRGTTAGAEGARQTLVWDSLLPPGDYLLELSPYSGLSLDPYRLSLTRQPYFDRPLDLEPNDEAWQARAIDLTGPLDGTVQAASPDWFRLGAGQPASTLQVTALEVPEGGVGVRLARAGDGAWPESLASVWLHAVGGSASLDSPGGDGLLLEIEGGEGRYALSFGPPGAAGPASPVPIDATLAFDTGAVAAYEATAQRLTGVLTLRNDGDAALTLETDSWTGDERWRLIGLPATIVLAAGGTAGVPVALDVAPDTLDDGPVAVEVALRDGARPPAVAHAEVGVSVGVAPVGAHPYAPLPQELTGGFDVAWSALGGTTDPALAGLIDGIVDAEGTALDMAVPADFDLAGDAPMALAGVILRPPPGGAPADRLARFAVEVSADGQTFTRVLEAELSPTAREQPFAFGAAVTGRLVRLVALSRHGNPREGAARLAEFEVVAAPGVAPPGNLDIASPALGGHVVRAIGLGEQAITGEASAWPGGDRIVFPGDRDGPAEWVLAFLDDRAARVAAITWHERADGPPEERMRVIEVAASTTGPLGPWAPLGRWQVDGGDGEPPVLTLAAPVWARALSFRVVEPAAGPVALPERVAVREAPAGPSVVGEWGEMSAAGPYEASLPPPPEAAPLPEVGHAAASATPLPLGTPARGRVRHGETEDWYAVDLPADTLWLRASFAGGRTPEVLPTLVDDGGHETVMVPIAGSPGDFSAPAGPGSWHVRVTQPPQSVVASWDTSASVTGFSTSIVRAVQQLTWGLDPEREAINLLPFRGEGSTMLLDPWSGDPAVVYGALHAYDWSDSSSDAENALLAAVSALQDRVGARAVVLITDAAYANVYQNEALWNAIDGPPVHIFALHVPGGDGPAEARAQANLMLDWANATGGFYTPLASTGDGEAAFRRVAAWLARPVGYEFALTAETEPLPPGQLSVVPGEAPAAAAAATPQTPAPAIEIVLDASGSMLAQFDGRARIEIAREALDTLGGSVLAEGQPVGLRVFGHPGVESCKSELMLPVAPLDRTAFAAAVAAVRPKPLAKTALAEAIRLAGDDLPDTPSGAVLVVITDGEETCGGDPLAEIERLRARGLDVRLQIVGFAVDDPALRETFERWAEAGGGAYFDAADAAGLQAAVQSAVALPFQVVDDAGVEQGDGTVGGAAIPLTPGRYRVLVGAAAYEVEIRSGEESRVTALLP